MLFFVYKATRLPNHDCNQHLIAIIWSNELPYIQERRSVVFSMRQLGWQAASLY